MSLTTSEMTPADFAAVTGNRGNGFGDGDGWWIILFLILAMGGNWGNGFGGNGGGSYPWMMTNTDNDVERGFDQMATMNGITNLQTAVTSGFANAATQLCGASSDIQMALANGFAGVEQGANARQMASMNQNFALQSALANCCCENRLGVADLKYTVATENCADRQALNEGVRDIIASQTAGTQRILDQLCADKIDAKNDEIAQLRQEVLFARGQASQVTQNASIINGVYDALSKCPVGTVPVYGEQPIFSCPNNNGCGCNGF